MIRMTLLGALNVPYGCFTFLQEGGRLRGLVTALELAQEPA